MKIRTYLAFIIFSSLLVAYGIHSLLSSYHDSIQKMSDDKSQYALDIQDFSNLKKNLSQMLISLDFVLGSGETYFSAGAIDQGSFILTRLNYLSSSSDILQSKRDCDKAINDITHLLKILIKATELENERNDALNDLLLESDIHASSLIIFFDTTEDYANTVFEYKKELLEKEKSSMKNIQYAALVTFCSFIIMLWIFSNRLISQPIKKLTEMTKKVQAGSNYITIGNGPKEILALSHHFYEMTESLRHQARHDFLTQLKNRQELERLLDNILQEAHAQCSTSNHTALFLDIDQFKVINDTCGHEAGNQLLINIASILRTKVDSQHTIARMGSDEFFIILHDTSLSHANIIAESLRHSIENSYFKWHNEQFKITTSIGMTAFQGTTETRKSIILAADSACRCAKEQGRNKIYTLNINDKALISSNKEMHTINQVKLAFDRGRFCLFFQKIIPAQSTDEHTYHHFEVLVRMYSEDGKLVPPIEFLPIIERHNLSSQLDIWVINATINWLIDHPHITCDISLCSINLSGASLNSDEVLNFIENKINTTKIKGSLLNFEITETSSINNLESAQNFINRIASLGCHFALDDFGVGASTFNYLKKLPIDYIKIDGSFIQGILSLGFNSQVHAIG